MPIKRENLGPPVEGMPRAKLIPVEQFIPEMDADFIDLTKVLGDGFKNWWVEQRILMHSTESVIGILKDARDGYEVPLTVPTVRAALRLILFRDGLPTQTVMFIDFDEAANQGLSSYDHVDVTLVDPTWPEGLEYYKEGMMHEVLSRPGIRKLFVDTEKYWQERGGKPKSKRDKQQEYPGSFALKPK